MQIENDSVSIKHPINRISYHKEYDYLDGEVLTKYGIVSVYSQGGEGYHSFSRLDIVYKARLIMRTFKGKRFTAKGLVTKANQYAKEIFTESA